MNSNIFFLFLFLILFLGGLGLKVTFWLGLAAFVLGLVFVKGFFLKKKMFPKGFFLYLSFLFFLVFLELLRRNITFSIDYILFFAAGGTFWLTAYYLGKRISQRIFYLIFVLGFGFLLTYLFYYLFNQSWGSPWGLVKWYSNLHHHLGDYWGLLVIALFWLILERKEMNFLIVGIAILGLAIVFFSLSRSAYVSFLVGAVFLFFKNKNPKKLKKILMMVGVLLIAIFPFWLTEGLKPVIYSRPFFFQGILGFLANPLGVGMGKFGEISLNSAFHKWEMAGYSSVAHNIFVEVLVGLGVFGGSFIAWFLRVVSDLSKSSLSGFGLLWTASFLYLAVNFFFDSTYLIPTMLWLWFFLLGLAQADFEKR